MNGEGGVEEEEGAEARSTRVTRTPSARTARRWPASNKIVIGRREPAAFAVPRADDGKSKKEK